MPAAKTQVKKIPVTKQLRTLLDEGAAERGNALSAIAFAVFRQQLEIGYKATTDTARRADLRIADQFLSQVIRAEKNEDTELLMELQRQLEDLQTTRSGNLDDV